MRPILQSGAYNYFQIHTLHRAYNKHCSPATEINPGRTFQTWLHNSDSSTTEKVMDSKTLGNLDADLAGDTGTGMPNNSSVRHKSLEKMFMNSKVGNNLPGPPDGSWAIEHYFPAKFAGSPECNSGDEIVQSVTDSDGDSKADKMDVAFEFRWQAPIPELNAGDDVDHNPGDRFVFKVFRIKNNGENQIGSMSKWEDKRGVYTITDTWKKEWGSVDNGEPSSPAKYEVRSYKFYGTAYVPDYDGDTSAYVEISISWPELECGQTGGQ